MIIDTDQAVMIAAVGCFVDDTRLWQAINATHGTNTLQQQLHHFYDWVDENNMHYNSEKVELMRYDKTEDIPIYLTPVGTAIKQKTSSMTLVYSCPPMPNLMCTSKIQL